jgi:hypothetical protein
MCGFKTSIFVVAALLLLGTVGCDESPLWMFFMGKISPDQEIILPNTSTNQNSYGAPDGSTTACSESASASRIPSPLGITISQPEDPTDQGGQTTQNTLSMTVCAPGAVLAEDQVCRVIKDTFCSATNRVFLSARSLAGDNLTYVVRSLPAHGTLMDEFDNLTITAVPSVLPSNRLKYVPTPGQPAGTRDSFTWEARTAAAVSAPATVSIELVDWFAPIGIPVPEFGITQTHRMYEGQLYDYDGDGTPEAAYKDAGNGPYTHYVDTGHPAATDDANPFGTPARPRLSVPADLPAGSVAEIHGTTYGNSMLYLFLRPRGTAERPVFVRGIGPAAKAVMKRPTIITGSYLIVEYLDVDGWSESADCGIAVDAPSDHVAIRHSEVHNGPCTTTSGVAVLSWDDNPAHISQQVVVYDVRSGNNGSWWNMTGDEDHQGMSIGGRTHHVWIVDCEMYHNSGDGLQINGDNVLTHHLYLGRTVTWENKQVGLGTKRAGDVIFSQNILFNHKPSDSSTGTGLCFIHGPSRVWFLYNRSYNNFYGIQGSSNLCDGLDGTEMYMIGNVIDNTTAPGICLWSNPGLNVCVVNNTISNTGGGIYCERSGSVQICNNIVSNLAAGSNVNHISVLYGSMADVSTINNNLFYQGGQPLALNWGGGPLYTTLEQFQAATGKGQACRSADPKILYAAAGDFRPSADSPAVNGGTEHPAYQRFRDLYGLDIAVDFTGTPRPAGGGWDIGACQRY